MPKEQSTWLCEHCSKSHATIVHAEECEARCAEKKRVAISLTVAQLEQAGIRASITAKQLVEMLTAAANDRRSNLAKWTVQARSCDHNYAVPHTCKDPFFDKKQHECPKCDYNWHENDRINTPG